MTYDSAWEASIRQLRSQDRLLAVRSLHYRVPQSEIKALCKAKLSDEGVIFHWRQDGIKPSHKHLSWVFIEAENVAERERAIVELDNLLVKGRPVKVGAVARRARLPVAQRRQNRAASAAGPSTTTTTTITTTTASITTTAITTTTTTIAAPVATMAPVRPPTSPPTIPAVARLVSAAPAANVAANSPSTPSCVIAPASNEIATTSISEETDE